MTETQKAIEAILEENIDWTMYSKERECVLRAMEAAYIAGRSKSLEEKDKEIEFLNQNCDNLNEVINDCGKEIGRLKGLMEVAFRYGFTNNFKKSTVDFQWQQFKTENNL